MHDILHDLSKSTTHKSFDPKVLHPLLIHNPYLTLFNMTCI